MKYRVYIFILIFLMISYLFANESVAGKESVLELDIESSVKSALENQLSVKTGQIELEQSERNYNHSWNLLLPSLTASVSGNQNSGLSSSNSSSNTTSFSANLDASLNLNLGLSAKIKALKAAYESGQRNFSDTLRQVEYEVRKAFYSILYVQSQLESSKETVESYKIQYEQTKAKKERGLVPEIDLLSSQVNYESAKIDLKNTEKSYTNALIEFLDQIGIEPAPGQKVELKGSLDDYESLLKVTFDEKQIDSLIENNSSVREIKDSLEAAKLSKTQAFYSSYFPSLTLSTSLNPYTYNYAWAANTSTDTNSWSASLGLSLSLDNLLPGSSASDSIKDLEDSIETLELQLQDKKREVKTSIFEMLNEIEIAKESLENCKLNVELADKTYELGLVAFKNGTKDLSSLQTIQTSYTNALLQLRNQQLTLINNILELKNTIGE
ncbi:MAG: TolC family protein [Treponema sp.]|nr:TolC family protein [Treponema sp.]